MRFTVILPLATLALMSTFALGQQADLPSTTTSGNTHGDKQLPFILSKDTTVITSPVLPDGTPDYIRALNDKYGKGVTPENNGYVVWLQITGASYDEFGADSSDRAEMLKMCGGKLPPAGTDLWEGIGDYLDRMHPGLNKTEAKNDLKLAASELWTKEQHPVMADYIGRLEKQLAVATEAVNRSSWWTPYIQHEGPATYLHRPRLTVEVGYVLCARATLRASKRNFDGFLSDTIAAKKLARHIAGGATVQEFFEGTKIEHCADEAIGVVVGSAVLDKRQCQELAKALDRLTPFPTLEERVNVADRWGQLDEILFFAAPSRISSLPPEFNIHNRDAIDWNSVLRQVNSYYDAMINAMDRPTVAQMNDAVSALEKRWKTIEKAVNSDTPFKPEIGETREAYVRRAEKVLLAIAAPEPFSDIEYRKIDLDDRMLRILVAAGELKATTGSWPKNLNILVPKYLSEIPKDIFSRREEDVRYVISNGKACIYSVGPNGKDDGGDHDLNAGKDDIVVGAAGPN